MPNYKVTIYKPQLEVLLNSAGGDVGRYLRAQGQRVAAGARGQVGVQTGRLRASIHIKKRGRYVRGQYIEVGSDLPYALMHHQGTKPHVILPTKGRVLRFFSKGTMVYTPVVNHPGTRPNRYLTNSLKLID